MAVAHGLSFNYVILVIEGEQDNCVTVNLVRSFCGSGEAAWVNEDSAVR